MKVLLTISIIALFVGCTSTDDKLAEKEYNLVISTGTQCGWCSGNDSLSVNSSAMHYDTDNPCNNPAIRIDMSTDNKDWGELEAALNWDEFKALDLNTCNYCADGCDTWISISRDDEYHRIRYGYQDSMAVKNIKPLIDKLAELKTLITSRQYNNSNN